MQIDGVPESVPWTKIRDILGELGIDAKLVLRNAEGVHISDRSITCEVKALDAEGRMFLDGDGNLATHHISIPVIWPKDEHES